MKGTWQTTGSEPSWGLILVVIVVLIVAGSGAASAIASAVTGLLVTLAIVLGSVIFLVVVGGIAWLIWRARQDRPARPIALKAIVQPPPHEARPRLEESPKLAIGPARNELHLHFHDMSPAQVAEAIRQANDERYSAAPRSFHPGQGQHGHVAGHGEVIA